MKLRLCLLASILVLSACYDSTVALNRSEIKQRLRAYWGEYDPSNSFYPDSVLYPVVSDAEYMIAHFGKAIERDTVINLLSSSEYYALPYKFDGFVSIYRHGKTLPSVMVTFRPQDQLSVGVENSDVSAQQFTIYNRKLYVYPRPKTSGDSLRLMYYIEPTPMTSDTSTSTLGDYWSRLVPVIANDLIRMKDQPLESIIQVVKPKIEDYRRNYLQGAAQ